MMEMKTKYHDHDTGYPSGHTRYFLTFFPHLIVFHTPICTKSQDTIHLQFWHDITEDDENHTHDKEYHLSKFKRKKDGFSALVTLE